MKNPLDGYVVVHKEHPLITAGEIFYNFTQWILIARLTYNNQQSLAYSSALTGLKYAIDILKLHIGNENNQELIGHLEILPEKIFALSKIFILYSAGNSISSALETEGYIFEAGETVKAASAFLLIAVIDHYPGYQNSFIENFLHSEITNDFTLEQ